MQHPKIFLLLLYYYISYLCGAAAAAEANAVQSYEPRIASNVSDDASFNATLDVGDAQFSVSMHYSDKTIDRLLLLRNTVEVMAELAQRNYHSHMTSFRSNWPFEDVLISVDPFPPNTDVANHIAIRCIWWAVYFLVLDRKFKEVTIDCKLDNVVLAQVRFGEGQPLPFSPAQNHAENENGFPGMSTNTTSKVGSLDGPISDTKPNGSHTLLDEQIDILFGYLDNSRSLAVFDVFIVVIGALSSVARWPSTEAVKGFGAGTFGPFDARLIFESARTIRATPPYYEYRHVIEALRRIPPWLMAQGKFKELEIGIRVDGVLLASANLRRSSPRTLLDANTPSRARMTTDSPSIAIA